MGQNTAAPLFQTSKPKSPGIEKQSFLECCRPKGTGNTHTHTQSPDDVGFSPRQGNPYHLGLIRVRGWPERRISSLGAALLPPMPAACFFFRRRRHPLWHRVPPARALPKALPRAPLCHALSPPLCCLHLPPSLRPPPSPCPSFILLCLCRARRPVTREEERTGDGEGTPR